jgi:hypothetical protein
LTARTRARLVLLLIVLVAVGISVAAFMRERDEDALRKEAASAPDASADAHPTTAKAKPAGKKKPRGGKTHVAARGGSPKTTHPTSHGNPPAAPHAAPHTNPHGSPADPAYDPSLEPPPSPHHAGGAPAAPPGGAHRSHAPPSGPTYESALDSNHQQVNIGSSTGPDLTDAQLSGPMSDGSFVSDCGAPDDMGVTVKVAIKNGHAVGVSVSTSPPSSDVAGCIDRHVRRLSWPSSPKMDSFVTTY